MPGHSHSSLPSRITARWSWRRAGFRSTAAWLLAFLIILPATAKPPRHQYEVKAALLHSFTKFVEWPEDAFDSPQAPFIIGIIGKDPFGSRIDTMLAGKTAQGHPIEIRRLPNALNLNSCHILFLGPMDIAEEHRVLAGIKSLPILTIGESDNLWRHHGAIQFVRFKNRVHFKINLKTTTQAGLKIDPKLLQVARDVKQADRKPKRRAPK